MLVMELKSLYQELEQAMHTFNAAWPKHCIEATVWATPMLSKQQAPDHIEIETHHGEAAQNLAISMLAQWHFVDGQHPATVLRLPGLIRLSANDELVTKLKNINRLKSEIKAQVLSIPRGSRPALVKAAFSGTSLLQLYRHIAYWDKPLRRLLFVWAGFTTSNKHVSRDTVMASLQRSRNHAPAHLELIQWHGVLDAELEQLADIPEDWPLLYRRRLAPHPRLMIYTPDTTKHECMLHANLPLFVFGDVDFECTDLGDFDASSRGRKRCDAREYQPFIERINLYANKQ